MNYRALWALAVAGLAIHFAGLGWDVYQHSTDSTLAAREDVLSLSNPSHLLIVSGMAIVAAALLGMAALWMNQRQFGGAGLLGGVVRGGALPVIVAAAAGAIWLASTAEDSGHDHTAADLDHHPVAVVQDAGANPPGDDGHTHETAASANSAANPLAAAAAEDHAHALEVAATAEQMVAAGQFALEVKEKVAKYRDIRDGMAAGYVQITPDLPGIAAHFIRLDYQHDGHEMDPDRPEVLLYSKRLDGAWRLVGVMFLAETNSDVPPKYFGALDVWHRHENLCFTAGGNVATTTRAECRNGLFVAKTAFQLHVWVEPGSTGGVFAHDYAPISPGAFPGATAPAASEILVQAR